MMDREALGREVRRIWIGWARVQEAPKPSWLVPWEGLGEPDREVDRRIGEQLYALGRLAAQEPGRRLAERGWGKVAVMSDVREQLADYAHTAWSGWMEYLFEKCEYNADGTATLPAWAVQRWQRQAGTPYAQLPEQEKESDRAEADRMLAIVGPRP